MPEKVLLSGFDMEPAERAIAEKVIRNFSRKISERSSYEYLKLRLKKSRKGKNFLHQVRGELKIKNKKFEAEASDYNLFSVLADVMEKLLNEMVHSQRK